MSVSYGICERCGDEIGYYNGQTLPLCEDCDEEARIARRAKMKEKYDNNL